MDLYFLRHGAAVANGERPLSEEGARQVKRIARWIKRSELGLGTVFTSPLVRARETADIVGAELGLEPVVTDLLDSGSTLRRVAELLAANPPDAGVLLVGHEPDFGTIISQLIGGGSIEMKKAGLARLECERIEAGSACLRWLLPPRLMER